MPYTDRFIATDKLVNHLSIVIATITDAAILSSYAGFLSVSAVTVYELAIKDIFNEFATKKNKVFGNFVENHFERINGRIRLDDLKNQHIKRFGDKYFQKFNKNLMVREQVYWSSSYISIKNSYTNLIQCRHNFVHQGSPTLTLNEVITHYQYGKEIIHCLNETMRR